ncbi:hypothetical protein [Flavobacterium notoginsengisoli]|uniref:hypothetical protein n=1 Tax=Flavobacterium notoginsengisoli TaxID=1478199 RepID=UPI003637029F
MKIIYRNSFNRSISEIENLKMNDSEKVFLVNNITKKIETNYPSGSFHVTYYKDNNEKNILEKLSKEYPNADVFKIRTRKVTGNHTFEIEDYIENGVLELKNNLLRDKRGRIVAYNQIDISNNQPSHEGSFKCFYSKTIYNNYCVPNLEFDSFRDKDFEVFSASYDKSGNLIEILLNSQSTYDKEYFFPNQPSPYDLETCRRICDLTKEQMNYFLTDELLPIPNFTIKNI